MITLPDWFIDVLYIGGSTLSGFCAGNVWGETDERHRQRLRRLDWLMERCRGRNKVITLTEEGR